MAVHFETPSEEDQDDTDAGSSGLMDPVKGQRTSLTNDGIANGARQVRAGDSKLRSSGEDVNRLVQDSVVTNSGTEGAQDYSMRKVPPRTVEIESVEEVDELPDSSTLSNRKNAYAKFKKKLKKGFINSKFKGRNSPDDDNKMEFEMTDLADADGTETIDIDADDGMSSNTHHRRHPLFDDAEEEGYIELTPQDDSPYPEVRASVPNVDDPTIPHNTVRMWTIGLLMTTLGCGLNVLFSLHSPVFQISTFVSAITAWPLGRLWDHIVPNVTVFGLQLNPSPFNIKEHALITIMANVSFGSGAAYLTDVIITMRHFYGMDFGWGFQIVAIIASQTIGYSIAGLVRRVLVYPASMIWPSNLVATTFLTNIHLKVNHIANGWRISRLRFFLTVMFCSMLWTWFPGFLAPFVSDFSIASWITPQNVVINQLFGVQQGLGMLPITFDWNQIAGYIGSPLIPPFFAIGNIIASILLIFWIVVPIIQYSNIWFGHYLPMSSINTYDRFQGLYNVSRILTPETKIFDLQGYNNYSPIFLSTTYIISYGMSFASISSTITHMLLFDREDIMYYWRNSRNEPDDIHMRLMKRYKEVPDWWFAVCFVLFFVLAVVSVRAWDTGLPVWALVVALFIALGLLIPVAFIYALTNIQVGLNVMTEFIVGYLVPGRPIAMMMFKTYGYITNAQAVSFLQDMKLGHYLKIAPRLLFTAQLVATIWGCMVQLVIMNWCQASIKNICSADQPDNFSCPQATVFFNASVIWGVIGPRRQFDSGSLYHSTLYFFILGAALPIISWLILKRWPKSSFRYVHWPVFFNGVGYIPPATPYNYATYCVVGYIFGYWIKRNWFNWWAKYNYTLSAGLDLGLALGSLLIFLVMLSPRVHPPNWWGSTGGAFNNADALAMPLKQLGPGEAFGPSTW
ncbi:oligopeptide transporter OPT1 [Sugiyamaella lignohabitans]|uniref:Oligopeptide transporter OPT1 n=1 Tax=Sugiyamaella lignohabitans TaxID=796027 RepID=A0A161HNX1_9ASCO|nr:oligopeptide transporter OPT1 [Sugiyamaella lignohabitans]ANB15917.1 oligopeptide transporter OPT1 [Sugiyamaella lignohabitans]